MRGLLLTNYYLVYRSFLMYMGLAILISGLILYFEYASMYRMAAMLPVLFAATPALEAIKHEKKSDYDKYVLTLPVTRSKIVLSHYVFYLLVTIIGILVSCGIFYVYGLVSYMSSNIILEFAPLMTCTVLIMGAATYPLLYTYGPEKSDAILLGSAIGGIAVTFGLPSLFKPLSNLNIDESLLDLIMYAGCGVVVYILSYFIATFIYHKKEF